jgi:hypothetical protein
MRLQERWKQDEQDDIREEFREKKTTWMSELWDTLSTVKEEEDQET